MTDLYLGIASLVITAISAAFWMRAIKRLEIPANRGLYIAAWLLAAASGIAALLGTPGWFGGIAAGAGALLSGLLLVTVAIGGQKVGGDVIQVGATIPQFTAIDEHGRLFDSHSLAGRPSLIKFFRGHW